MKPKKPPNPNNKKRDIIAVLRLHSTDILRLVHKKR